MLNTKELDELYERISSMSHNKLHIALGDIDTIVNAINRKMSEPE